MIAVIFEVWPTDGRKDDYFGIAASLLILPIDLPFLQTRDLREIATLGRQHEVVICPDKHYAGTNAIVFAEPKAIQFSFGPGSYLQHQREALRCGLVPRLYYNPRIAKDIDLPEDLIGLHNQGLLPASVLRPVHRSA
jgi:2-phospho-L-lactate guanylyltransferase